MTPTIKQAIRSNKNKCKQADKLKKNKDSDSDSDNDYETDASEDIEDDSSEADLSDDDDEDYETVSESSDSSYRPNKRNKKVTKKTRKQKQKQESESEEEEEEEDSDDDVMDSDDDEVVDNEKFKKYISKIFPSKYMSEKVKANEKPTKKSKSSSKQDKKASKSKDRRRRRHVESSDDEEEDDDDDEEEEESTAADKYDIIFAINGAADDEDGPEEYDEEGDDVDCDSDDEKMFMKETYENVEIPEKETKSKKQKKQSKHSKHSKKSKSKKSEKTEESTEQDQADVEGEYLDLLDTKKQLSSQLQKRPNNKILRNAIEECNTSIKELVKKARITNAKTYHKLIHDDQQYTNEVDYFKKKLSNKEQLRIMKDLKEINKHINVEKPYRLALLESKIPAKLKSIALQKLNILRCMDPGDNEYYKIKNWVDTFMRIPFCMYKNLSVRMDDGLDKCHDFMLRAKNTLDECVFGLNDAKLQIMQMLGQWISNPSSLGTAIAIKGPPGTGKTTLVKEGISKILGREFAFLALGGAGDASFLEGHSYTYEGSSWGKIVQILLDSKCMNPVIYFDELDKISESPRGEEIVGILTHLTDTSQNNQYHDKYFSDVDFDLSKCLFIFSYNDESKVNPILKDRMYRIQTKGYDAKEKLIIARDHLLPKIREQVNFTDSDVIIPDDTIQYLISKSSFTRDESGVRNLKRCLEIIYTKLNLFRLVKPEANMFGKDIDIAVSFPFTVNRKAADIFIKAEDNLNQSMLAMYC
jgi:ATP-dependent Lon protease